MADVIEDMDGVGGSSSKCREARRRRIEMRRMAIVVAGGPPESGSKREADDPCPLTPVKRSRVGESDHPPPTRSSSSSSSSSSSGGGGGGEGGGGEDTSASSSVPRAVSDRALSFGSVALFGRSREMEDAVAVQPRFFRPAGGSPLHFFAVFDGHGGSHVSRLCMERMHVLLAEELARGPPAEAEEEALAPALKASFARMDELALASCACGRVSDPRCTCERSGFESDIVGSTAVAAVVGPRRVLVANCGDSRAVLCRGGTAVPMSIDHKPDRPDELARIEAAGGRVIYLNGARVDGILAMSRAIGDKYFKPVVISEPEIRIVERHPQDECLIIASDGLWDVVPNDLACDVARRCLMEGNPMRGAGEPRAGGNENTTGGDVAGLPESRCSLAANLLARLALGRQSEDNVSVIVVDLRSG
ncbi:putative protein phosphatase 2C 37 [Iris pallida]|uniref:protein-serine/threonine phosphatase n=1 Tax=Iris pallida TaxID=29817 RepID=A0AAX6F1A0_IRIPA|nr:putative protein phosphatase 2C 37 [Iris pallida]